MRRFIDVDELEEDVEYWENHDDPKKPDYDTRDIEQVIGSQPIVEAIPIAFIEEQMRNHYERAHNSALAIQQRNYDRAIALADLINDWHDWYDIWEKENETR